MKQWAIALGVLLLAAASGAAAQDTAFKSYSQYDKTQVPKEQLKNCRFIQYRQGGVSHAREWFCDDPSGRLIKLGRADTLPRDYIRPDQMAPGMEDPRQVLPDRWVGRKPTELIMFMDMFYDSQVKFYDAIAYADGLDPEHRPMNSIVWGHVIKAQADDAAHSPIFVFPFCYPNECTDPDAGAPNFGVLAPVPDFEGRPDGYLYLAVATSFGMRYCRVYSGDYQLTTCYNERVKRPTTAATLAQQGRDLAPRYKAIGDFYEKQHPAEAGSLKDIADHAVCDYHSYKVALPGGRFTTQSHLECEYRPDPK